MKRSTTPESFLNSDEKVAVDLAIKKAEQTTSAEIKLLLVKHCWGRLVDKAISMFQHHNLDQTKERNCVLIMLVLTNREFIIYGDEGIHQQVGEQFWLECRNEMLEQFKQDKFGDGLARGIGRIGDMLKELFPWQQDDRNEIGDEIVYEN